MSASLQIRGTLPCSCGKRVALFRIAGPEKTSPWFVVCPNPACPEKTIRHATAFDEMSAQGISPNDPEVDPMRRQIATLLAKLSG